MEIINQVGPENGIIANIATIFDINVLIAGTLSNIYHK